MNLYMTEFIKPCQYLAKMHFDVTTPKRLSSLGLILKVTAANEKPFRRAGKGR